MSGITISNIPPNIFGGANTFKSAAGQSIPDSAWTVVSAGFYVKVTNGWSFVANSIRFPANVNKIFMIGYMGFVGNAVGYRGLRLTLGTLGSGDVYGTIMVPGIVPPVGDQMLVVSGFAYGIGIGTGFGFPEVPREVRLECYQNSGAPLFARVGSLTVIGF